MDFREFANAINPVAEYYGRSLGEQPARIYFAVVKPLDVATFRQALLAHIADPNQGKYWPTAAHVLDQVAGEDGERERLFREFDGDPLIDGTRSHDARMETIEQRKQRRERYVKSSLATWRRLPLPEKIAHRKYVLGLEDQAKLEGAA